MMQPCFYTMVSRVLNAFILRLLEIVVPRVIIFVIGYVITHWGCMVVEWVFVSGVFAGVVKWWPRPVNRGCGEVEFRVL